jgi:hypothetical protein
MSFATPARTLAIVTIVTALALPAADSAAASRATLSPGLLQQTTALETVERFEMAAADPAPHLAADEAKRAAGEPSPLRFAVPVETAISPDSAGTWTTMTDGSKVWRLRIAAPGTRNLNLHFDRFALPAQAAVWLYDPNGSLVQGPYTSDDRNAEGELWTAVVSGDELVVELHLPPGGAERTDLRIAAVNHGFRDFADLPGAAPKQGSCNNDVICPEGDPWRDQIRSVARITIVGAFLCTGQLVNNTAEDGTPYFLTAQHCVENASQANSVVAFWNFEAPVCGQLSGGSLSQNQSGASLVSLWEWQTGSDFALILLDEEPASVFNVHYAGWDATGNPVASSVGIHHPSGDEKAISFDDDPLTKSNHYGFGDHQWRVGQWEDGTTEGGSSGSCIFDATSRLCVGTLTAGSASCSNLNGFDIYGRMDAHWTGDGSPSGRLSDWLDPLGTGALTLAGRDPGGLSGTQTWLVPAAASTPGVGTSNWKTQIVVTNPTGETRQARIYFVERGEAWPGDPLGSPYVIPAGGSLSIDDPLLALNPTNGLLYVTVDSEGMPVMTRTYNLASDGGTFGQGIPGILLDEAAAADRLILPMLMSDPDRFRTNVGIVQTSSGSIAVRVQLHDTDGTVLATKAYSSSSGFLQINDVLANMGIGNAIVEGGWISVELLAGSPSYWTAYASIVDGSTDDPTYVLPVAD